jgi:hypothetical protein
MVGLLSIPGWSGGYLGTVIPIAAPNDSGRSPAQKQQIIDIVSGTAEKVRDFLNSIAPNQVTQDTIDSINKEIVDPATKQYRDIFDPNESVKGGPGIDNSFRFDPGPMVFDPNTMGWGDLLGAWLFEAGGTKGTGGVYDFTFQPGSKISNETLALPAVQEAIKEARKIRADLEAKGDRDAPFLGPTGSYEKEVTFGFNEAVRTIKQMDCATGFLGSYHISITGRGSGELTVQVTNTTGWVSGTRFIKPAQGMKGNQGVLEDRMRGGPGIHLGGNITQTIINVVPAK